MIQNKKFKGICPGSLNSVIVEDGDIGYALRQWKKNIKLSGIVQECYDRKFFKKPSTVNRVKRQIAIYKLYKETISDD